VRDTCADATRRIRKDSRIITSATSTNEELEKSADKIELLRTRCSLEIIILMFCCMLNLRHASFETPDEEPTDEICAPYTGCRFLGSMPDGVKQIEHVDYYFNSSSYTEYLPEERKASLAKEITLLTDEWRREVRSDPEYISRMKEALHLDEGSLRPEFKLLRKESPTTRPTIDEPSSLPPTPAKISEALTIAPKSIFGSVDAPPVKPITSNVDGDANTAPRSNKDTGDSAVPKPIPTPLRNEKQKEQRKTQIDLPPYFAIISGATAAKIYCIPKSTQWLFEDDEKIQMLQRGGHIEMKTIEIPPWSMIIVRGDLLHSGAEGNGTSTHLRLHMYIIRIGVAVPDSINERLITQMSHPVYSSSSESDEARDSQRTVQTGKGKFESPKERIIASSVIVLPNHPRRRRLAVTVNIHAKTVLLGIRRRARANMTDRVPSISIGYEFVINFRNSNKIATYLLYLLVIPLHYLQ